jgi:Cu(I)/Ag(I) efflux system membrane fusion protein
MKIKTVSILLTAAAGLLLNVNTHAADSPALMQPVKLVYDYYLKIQTDLANDSLKGVSDEATAIAKAIQGDEMKMLPAVVGTEAEAVAKASDLKSARAAFKPLSDSLIKYLADHHAKDAYVQMYCPMAKASWLQADKNVSNPYLGQDMPTCGVIKN